MSGASGAENPLLERRAAVEAALRAHVDRASEGGLPLYRMMQYQLGWVDKDGLERPPMEMPRTYGSLCLEAAELMGGGAGADQAGAATELFHESTVVHEQMQTGEADLDTSPAVWWVWGPAQAINVGDGLHALARLAVLRLRERDVPLDVTLAAMRVLDDLALRYYEGQYIELTYQERVDITTAQYSSMARSKLGALLGGAMALGARMAGGDDPTAAAFWELGAAIGEAAQVQADVDALWRPARGPQGRVLNKSKLYPVVHLLEHGTLKQKRAVGTIYFKRVMEAPDVDDLRAVLDEAGIREQSEARVEELVAAATGKIETIASTAEAKERWQRVVSTLVSSSSV